MIFGKLQILLEILEFGGLKTDKSNNTNQSDVNLVVPGAADSGNMHTVIAEFKKIY